MKRLTAFTFLLSGLVHAAPAAELACRYDERARDGGAGLVQLKREKSGSTTVLLTQTRNRFGETSTESMLYSNAECRNSPKNALLFNCRAGVEIEGVKGEIEIESSISYVPGIGEMLNVTVDPSRAVERAAGVAPKLKTIRMPLAACKPE